MLRCYVTDHTWLDTKVQVISANQATTCVRRRNKLSYVDDFLTVSKQNGKTSNLI